MSVNYILLIYILITFLLFIVILKASYKLNLVDVPNKRKTHSKPTAYTGGLVLSLSYIISNQLFEFGSNNLSMVISIAFLISITGFVDDKYNLNIGGKLSLQIISIFYFIFSENMNLTHLGDYEYFKLELGTLTMPFTLLSALFLINAFNYFDGIDGSLSFTVISVLTILYFLAPDKDIKIFLVIILLPIIVFLFFNFSLFNLPKAFLGDSGSMLLGFIISFILIFYSIKNITHPILLAWSVAIFVYEFISVNIERINNNKKLFKAGLDHLHHHLLKKNKSVFLTNFFLFSTNIILFITGYTVFNLVSPFASLVVYILSFIAFFILRKKYFSLE